MRAVEPLPKTSSELKTLIQKRVRLLNLPDVNVSDFEVCHHASEVTNWRPKVIAGMPQEATVQLRLDQAWLGISQIYKLV